MAFTTWVDKNRRVLRGWQAGNVVPSGIPTIKATETAVREELGALAVASFKNVSINQQRSTAA